MRLSHTVALVANTTSRMTLATSEWREHFKMLECTRGESPIGIRAISINRFLRILEIYTHIYTHTHKQIHKHIKIYLSDSRLCKSSNSRGRISMSSEHSLMVRSRNTILRC